MATRAGANFRTGERSGRDALLPLVAVRAFFSRRVSNHDVDDMVQEVALRLEQRRGQDAIENVEGYAFQIAHSVLADRGRRDKVRCRAQHEPLEDCHHPIEERSPERVMEGREALALVLESLAELPDRTRQVFVLHRFEEMSYAGISHHMGISVSAVEKHIMKAIRHLAARVGK